MSTISSNFTTSLNYVVYRIVVTEIEQSIANNSSQVRVEVQAKRTTQGLSISGGGKASVIVDGRTYTQDISATTLISTSFVNVFMQDFFIEHEPDGSKTIFVSAKIENDPIFSNYQGFNVTLTKINRQATIKAVSSSFSESEPLEMTYENLSGYGLDSLQACVSLDGQTPFTSLQSIDLRDLSAKKILVLSQADYNKLNMQFPNSKKERVYVLLISIIDGIYYFSSKATYYKVVDANPTITGGSYKDTNSAMIAITGNNQKIVQDNSTIQFKISSIKANKYSTLKMLTIDVNGKVISSPLSGTSISNKTVSFGATGVSKNTQAVIKVTDSRDNVSTIKLNLSVYAWSLPTALISLYRKSNYYDETTLKVNSTYSSLGGNNTLLIQYQYKERSSSTWSSLTTISNLTEYELILDNTKAYDFKIILADRIGTTTYNKVVDIGIPIIFFDRLLRSVGIGSIPTEQNQLCVDRRLELKNALQESLADLWTSGINDNYRTAFLQIKNQNGKIIGIYGGDTANGNGCLKLYDKNQLLSVSLDINSYGGYLYLYNSSGRSTADLYTGTSGDGTLNLYNANEVNTINCSGLTGKITCVSLTQTSSRKVKENIKPLTAEEAYKILELVAVTFDFIEKAQGEDKRGFIAEDVAEVIPEIVTPETEQTNAALDYIQMIPYLQTVIKDQEKRIKELESKLEDLTRKFDSLSS